MEARTEACGGGSEAGIGAEPLRTGFWSVWLGKERKEEGTTSTSFHLSLTIDHPPRVHAILPGVSFHTSFPHQRLSLPSFLTRIF